MAPSGPTCPRIQKIPGSEEPGIGGAPEGIRTPNLLIRSQMLYPLSYRRMFLASDFFNPSRQQVILYGGYEEPASRKTQKGLDFLLPESLGAPFCREIPGFLVPGKFFKIFLCGSKREVGIPPREPSAPYDSYPPALEFLIDCPRCLPVEGVTGGTQEITS